MRGNITVYILIMAAVTYLVRALPLTLIRRQITSPFIRSFLYYMPYVTLAVMTFPAILQATGSVWPAWAALVLAVVLAWRGAGLIWVAVGASAAALVLELLL